MVATGSVSALGFEKEASFGAGGSSYGVALGVSQKLTNLGIDNSVEVIPELGQRYPNGYFAKQFAGAVSVEFLMSNGNFFDAIFGSKTDNSDTGYTQYDYTIGTTVNSYAAKVAFTNTSTTYIRELKGIVFTRARISARVNSMVTVGLDGLYKTEVPSTGTFTGVKDTYTPFRFFEGKVSDATLGEIGKVQSFDLSVANNVNAVYELNNRLAVGVAPLTWVASGRMVLIVENQNWLKRAYGSDSATGPENTLTGSTVTLYFDTGDAVGDREITFTLNSAKVATLGETYIPGELIMDDVVIDVSDVTAIYKEYTA